MIEDFKQFLKFYRAYKKGKENMDKIKEWVDSHSKEILLGIFCVMSYQIGFKRGFKTGIKFEDALLRLSTKGGGNVK